MALQTGASLHADGHHNLQAEYFSDTRVTNFPVCLSAFTLNGRARKVTCEAYDGECRGGNERHKKSSTAT